MKIAMITGITGQDGRFLTRFLEKKNYQVIGLVPLERQGKLVEFQKDFPNTEIVIFDYLDSRKISELLFLFRPDEFYNLAAASSVKQSFEDPLATAQITALAPVQFLEVLRKHRMNKDIRFYQASSSEMYGNSGTSCKTEDSTFEPTSPYGVSKLYAHQMSNIYKEAYGMFISCGILFNHESSFRTENFVSRKISMGVARIANGKSNKMTLGALNPKRDWGFAGDYVEAMWLMLQHNVPDNFVVASGRQHSVLDFASQALAVAGLIGDPMEYIDMDPILERPLEIHSSWGDATKAREELGWRPKVAFEQLVEMMVMDDIALEARIK